MAQITMHANRTGASHKERGISEVEVTRWSGADGYESVVIGTSEGDEVCFFVDVGEAKALALALLDAANDPRLR